MTLDDLRKLADEATPGPWGVEIGQDGRDSWVESIDPVGIETEGGHYGPNFADARLIALAPDLARLCAEFGEVLGELDVHTMSDYDADLIRRTRAKLSELEAR